MLYLLLRNTQKHISPPLVDWISLKADPKQVDLSTLEPREYTEHPCTESMFNECTKLYHGREGAEIQLESHAMWSSHFRHLLE
jgi:hypothetical protein